MTRIVVREHVISIPRLPDYFSGYKIIQVSDIHLGRRNVTKPLLRTISELQGDILALTGDFIDYPESLPMLHPFLTQLVNAIHPPDGIVGVWGNHDRLIPPTVVADFPIRWLNNYAIQIHRDSAFINLLGVNQQRWAYTNLLRTLTNVVPGGPMILFAHYPSTAYLLNGIFDLVISGHTHHGQIRIPGLPFAPNDNLPCQNAYGVSTLGKTKLVVSAGVGYSGRIAFRLFAPPEVTVIQLKSEK